MGLQPDHWIKKMALEQRMIEPFVDTQVRQGVISYGLSSYGYDIRVADEFKIFQPEVTANKLSDVQCAYVAGMIDSLGCIDYSPPGKSHRSLQLTLTSAHVAALERFQEVVGAGGIRANEHQSVSLVVAKPADVQYILAQVMPYLMSKRESAQRTLAELKATKSIVVDPKDFDANSFVDFQGDVCVIPPNSFALSRTVEYFRIPRSTLTLCVGKSTYARCFRGDTRVALVDGTAPTLEDMAHRAEKGEMFWGYSIGSNGRMIATLLDSPRYIGQDALLEVVIDTEKSIFCTSDHQFMLRDGRWRKANDLRPGDSLMPLYRNIYRGYEMAYQPLTGHFYPTHRMADEWNLRNEIYVDLPDTHRHHLDHNRRNNNPWNIARVDASEHIKYHNQQNFGKDFDPKEHSRSIREAFERLSQDPEWQERFSQAQRSRVLQFWRDDAYAETRDRVIEQRRNPSDATRQAHREATLRRFSDPAERVRHSERIKAAWAKDDGTRRQKQAEIARQINLRADITAQIVRDALDQTGSIRGAARLLNCDRSVFRRFPDVFRAFRGQGQSENHKVVAIRGVPGVHDVYCLTVPEAGNFALAAGIFVHNCGIIVNVTPFEPGWEGYVTLEISNTTPLPAKIYANEGIAQVLFFEGDQECDISYAEKKGKYQSQQAIVLPRL